MVTDTDSTGEDSRSYEKKQCVF